MTSYPKTTDLTFGEACDAVAQGKGEVYAREEPGLTPTEHGPVTIRPDGECLLFHALAVWTRRRFSLYLAADNSPVKPATELHGIDGLREALKEPEKWEARDASGQWSRLWTRWSMIGDDCLVLRRRVDPLEGFEVPEDVQLVRNSTGGVQVLDRGVEVATVAPDGTVEQYIPDFVREISRRLAAAKEKQK